MQFWTSHNISWQIVALAFLECFSASKVNVNLKDVILYENVRLNVLIIKLALYSMGSYWFLFKTRISFSALNSNSLATIMLSKHQLVRTKRDVLFQLNCIVFVWVEGTIPMQIEVCKSM